MGYVELGLAIIFEVVGTNLMKASAGFTRPLLTTLTVVAYLICFYSFAQALKSVNLSVAYATWGGIGIILTTIVSVIVWQEKITWTEIFGIGLIVAGVVLCNFFAGNH